MQEEIFQNELPPLSVSDALKLINGAFEVTIPVITVVGEVSSYKVSKGKWVYFDIKDEEATLNCFTTVYQMRQVIEDGMKIELTGRPNLTKWGRFSLTVQTLRPVGDGSIKKAFELTKKKLAAEGLFDETKKRSIPEIPQSIVVISSAQAAGYADFTRILNDRWPLVDVSMIDVQVQGERAVNQIIRAIEHVSERIQQADAVVLIRGGGSADDLAAFNAEQLVRAVSRSRVPVVVGVGHETDLSLAGMAADVNAATPTHAAELIAPDASDIVARLGLKLGASGRGLQSALSQQYKDAAESLVGVGSFFEQHIAQLGLYQEQLRRYDPRQVLKKGYALLKSEDGTVITDGSKVQIGDRVSIRFLKNNRKAEIVE